MATTATDPVRPVPPVPPVPARLRRLRREAGRARLLSFARTYLPAHFRLPPSLMHREIAEQLEDASAGRGARLAIAAPRGNAKSTLVSLAYILWSICYEQEQFILLISNTIDQASDFLSQIRNELEFNPLLREDFPEVCDGAGTTTGTPRWRRDEIITPNGVKVTALGAEKKIRGRRHQEFRPTLIVLDDIENEVEVRSPDQRRRKMDWLTRAVLKAGTSHTNVVVVGTILHYDALLANLIDQAKSPGWEGSKYQAVRCWSQATEHWTRWESIYCRREDFHEREGPTAAQAYFQCHREEMLSGTEVLWPELEDYAMLMRLRINEGRAAFDSEKQNDPVNPEDCYFMEEEFQYWDDQHPTSDALLEHLAGHVEMYGACDPSLGKRGRHADDSAIVTLARDTTSGVLYVLDADIRRRKPDAIIEDVIRYELMRRYQAFGMETNQFQEFLSDELRRRSAEQGVYIRVHDFHSVTDKIGRIQRLQPLISSGLLRFSRRHVALLDQLRQFPMAAHDDGPDALEMAVSVAGRPSATFDAGPMLSLADYDPFEDDALWTAV